MNRWLLSSLLGVEILLFNSISGPPAHSFQEWIRYYQTYLADLLAQSAPILLLGFGMTFVLITAGIDLSVGHVCHQPIRVDVPGLVFHGPVRAV